MNLFDIKHHCFAKCMLVLYDDHLNCTLHIYSERDSDLFWVLLRRCRDGALEPNNGAASSESSASLLLVPIEVLDAKILDQVFVAKSSSYFLYSTVGLLRHWALIIPFMDIHVFQSQVFVARSIFYFMYSIVGLLRPLSTDNAIFVYAYFWVK
jgi:hypothetical protein